MEWGGKQLGIDSEALEGSNVRACDPYTENCRLVPTWSSLKTYHHIGWGWSGWAPGAGIMECSVLRLCLVYPTSMVPSESLTLLVVVFTNHLITKREKSCNIQGGFRDGGFECRGNMMGMARWRRVVG